MTQEQYVEKLKEIIATHDQATGHRLADLLLCSALRELGFLQLAELFLDEDNGWWYA